ncbi:phenylalanine--tRNA ligase subunit alpha [Malacoplasma penetrans]|uniref:Phenylalanine--tRNA ligase alpha subunit n=1 Tax=Malacoplasma penetrans (strain HF-2) TaxID=272633 RepID=SYFA_MALP2|nr:phenylalanine--tRNA ligase subunit alpha [Malacoplasma penetrans]Q8EUJ8.1 RecName: Full=Phenylalanine--tRNA ligase alpha subunit; AltName: Full=Phenylalanyl-tRNA synthetase alpha subunit; Short=PheRS [Malacoplasma penetrans HF-2]RXY97128.1 phenylalanine--tRNA ligase subunit alpha [Malacoplasma penetrans]BAC44714.1 phenylalanyl-tRNA synthetase subunit alpha [Malacoplasma penetrans HF-2]
MTKIDFENIKILQDKIKDIEIEKNVYDERNIFLKNYLSPLYKELKEMSEEDKKEFGKQLNQYKEMIEDVAEKRINEIKKQKILNIKSEYDINLPADYFQSGGINPIDLVKNEIVKFFKKANFKILTESEVTSVEFNFDSLNIKKDHPARSISDTFYIDDKQLLRVHNTAITSKALRMFNKEEEIKVLSHGNVYRKDDDDATHSHQFNQIDMVWVKKGMSLANLKWLTDKLLKYLFNESIKIRYRISHFPFTEPSFEVDINCFFCDSKDHCSVCKNTKWIEVLGAGLLHPNVLKNANVKKGLSGIAFGIGIDRIAMLKYQIKDIRRLYGNDFSLIESFKGER